MPADTHFWVALAEIVWINILLSGDNAVVIALACRSLPEDQRKWGILLGVGPAVVLRIIFTLFIGTLMAVPFLKLIGAALLLWIAVKLMLPEDEDPQHPGEHRGTLWAAARTIIVADAVMSLDNVIAIAAAAKGDWLLLIVGLLLSMPMIIFGSALLLRVMERFPILVTAGAGLLGWIAGELVLSDPLLEGLTAGDSGLIDEAVPALGAALVVATGHIWAALRRREQTVAVNANPD